jgi:oxaloacetate decarboxylase alpha subunit
MLLRGQNLLGYRHYADDVVEAFVDRAAENGIDVFRIFDAMNDVRNLETAVKATLTAGKHAQGTISYTVSPVHSVQGYVDMGCRLEDLGCHSICIKDMAGLLKPYVAFELVSKLKAACDIPVAMQSHATTGMSTATAVKAVEAGIDVVDTAISSMSMTYGHSPTEALVAIFQDTEHDTGLDLHLLEEIAAYFRPVRKKYARFEGSLRGVDARILVAQVPGGMLTNMESQLREQNALDRLDEVLEEIPRVREDLGFIPLVTPTSQIVGTQAVLNVLTGERYRSITKETAAVLRGEYGATPAPVNAELQTRVLEAGQAPVTVRPADLIEPEIDRLGDELRGIASEKGFRLAEARIEDVLIYAQFPQIGLKFLENRGNPEAFEPAPLSGEEPARGPSPAPPTPGGPESYRVVVDGKPYQVTVESGGELSSVAPAAAPPQPASGPPGAGEVVPAPLAGNIFKIRVQDGDSVASGDVVMVLEAMKMETEVRAPATGIVSAVRVREGDAVHVGDPLFVLS